MFKNKLDMPLKPEIVSRSATGEPDSILVRYAMEFGCKSGHTGGNARRIKAIIARLLDTAELLAGENLPPCSLLRKLLELDGLTTAQRQEARKCLGVDLELLKPLVKKHLMKVLLSSPGDPEKLKAPLKEILKRELPAECWSSLVKDSEIKTAVANVVKKMCGNLAAGEVRGGTVVPLKKYNRKARQAQVAPRQLSASGSARCLRRW